MSKFLNISTDNTLGGNSSADNIVSSQKAVKDYVDAHSGGSPAWGNITGTLSNQADLQLALDGKQATLVSGTNIKTINGNSILGSGDLTVSGGASRNIGEIVQSTIPLTDAGLHLLDGSLISGSGIYSNFVTYIAGLVSTNPEIFASGYESETSVGSAISGGDDSRYPNANAFDGSTSTFWCSSQRGSTGILGHSYIGRSGLTKPVKKVRMMQGYTGQTVNYCSQLLFQYSNDGTTWIDITSISDGANLTWQEWVLPDYTPTGDTHSFRVLAYGGFSGSTSNSWSIAEVELYYWSTSSEAAWQQAVSEYGVCEKYVYDSVNNTVRLPKFGNQIYTSEITTPLDGYWYIVVANSTKTEIEVDIDEIASDLNGKADVDLSNMNPTQTVKNTIVGWGMPDFSAGVAFTGTITLPCDALVYSYKSAGGAWDGAGFYINSVLIYNSSAYTSTACCYAAKGSTVQANAGSCKYYPLKGVN